MSSLSSVSSAFNQLPPARYSFGGDEHIFVEIDEAMSLPAFFKGMAITRELQRLQLSGVTEICPANASYLVRFDPDQIAPEVLQETLQAIERDLGAGSGELDTRVIDIPVLYNDPWTNETMMRFRERHQDPSATDLEYAARMNGKTSVDEFIAAHAGAPWFVSMVGFVAGLPFLFQMADRAFQLEVPKYLRPRTDTPRLTIGHGGCFSCIYSVRGAGGYQMFGITPAPIFDPQQSLAYFKDDICLFAPGDIVRWRPINRAQYDEALREVEAGTFQLRINALKFSLDEFLRAPTSYSARLMEA